MTMSGQYAWDVYPAFLKISFVRQASFRIANLAGLFTNTFFMLFRTSVFQALFTSSAVIAGYTVEHALTYAVFVQALIMVVPQWGQIGVAEDIRSGQVAMDLCRPLNYYLMIMSKRLGISFFFLVARGIPALIIGAAFDFFKIVPDLPRFVSGCLSLLIGIWLANSIHFLVELSGFWLESPRGPKMFVVAATYFLSGSVIPIALFPPWAQAINAWLPFQYTLNAPIEIFMGKTDIFEMLGLQLIWFVLLTTFCMRVLQCGERKVVLHGG